MLGPAVLVAPVLTPAEEDDSLARVNVWLPPGQWVEDYSGTVISVKAPAGQTVTRRYPGTSESSSGGA